MYASGAMAFTAMARAFGDGICFVQDDNFERGQLLSRAPGCTNSMPCKSFDSLTDPDIACGECSARLYFV